MKVYGSTTHWRFACSCWRSDWYFGGHVCREGLFVYFGSLTLAIWRQQRAIP